MRPLTDLDLIWNRACFGEATDLRSGDVALAALLLFHGPAMNGGVLHAIECLGAERLAEACEGFRYFGFSPIASDLEDASRALAAAEDLDELAEQFDKRYWRYVPEDGVLVKAFESDYAARPENYAPLE
jgi:hypothetical protein